MARVRSGFLEIQSYAQFLDCVSSEQPFASSSVTFFFSEVKEI